MGLTAKPRQNDELVKAKIKALTEKNVSRGCTEQEALLAAALVGKLLDTYSLTMDEIGVRGERCVMLYHKRGGKNRQPVDYALSSIAIFCECKFWTTAKHEALVVAGNGDVVAAHVSGDVHNKNGSDTLVFVNEITGMS